jgi:tetratricopeptide (TPR) repeat protein
MERLVTFLYIQRFQDATFAVQLTLLELANMLAVLAWLRGTAFPEKVLTMATCVEALLAYKGLSHALTQVTVLRNEAAQALAGWSRAHYFAEIETIERLLERGYGQRAHTAAQCLLERCLADGDTAYQDAPYDIALAYWELGRTLLSFGDAEAALQPLTEAQQRFQALAEAGDINASFMVAGAIIERGACLTALGRLDKAAAAYEDAIQRVCNDQRSIAVCKGQLGTVRLLQKRYAEALTAYQEALSLFGSLGEPSSMGVTWHQIGMVYRYTRQFAQAEKAYRQALAVRVQQQEPYGEASSLGELGLLYNAMGRPADAVAFYRQAAAIFVTLKDLKNEGVTCTNLADTLMTLKRYNDARQELQRAIACNKPFGHSATPWKTWAQLHELEQATGNAYAAADAWQQAVQCYLAYRRDGGESQEPGAQLCTLIEHAICQGDTTEVTQCLARAAMAADTPARLKAMLPKLDDILDGDRDPALASDPALYYADAAELHQLLEKLGAQ